MKGIHILKKTIVNLSMRTINHEQRFDLKIILNATKRCVYYLGVGFVGFILKQIKFVRCDMNDVTIRIEKNVVYYVISFREG